LVTQEKKKGEGATARGEGKGAVRFWKDRKKGRGKERDKILEGTPQEKFPVLSQERERTVYPNARGKKRGKD